MKTVVCFILLGFFSSVGVRAQVEVRIPSIQMPEVSLSSQSASMQVTLAGVETNAIPDVSLSWSPDKKDDPGYKKYKEGYNRILDERWEDARKQFKEMISQYPKSEYVDDAEYWSAYALEHLEKNKKVAYKAFREFIFKYPESNYYDDAVAEMFKLNGGDVGIGKSASGMYMLDKAIGTSSEKHGIIVQEPNGKGGFRYRYQTLPSVPRSRVTSRTLDKLEHELSLTRKPTVGVPVPVPDAFTGRSVPVLAPGLWGKNDKLDPETRLKMDALYALGNTQEDSLSFATLREVVTNPKQPLALRESAMDVLSEFRKFDVLGVFLEVAKKDTSEEVQNMSIDYIGQISSDKDKSVGALIDLYSVIPRYRVEKLQTVLWSIGEIGNRRAVNFLAKVAKSDDNYVLRSDAVHHLGNIGGADARKALYDILKEK